MLVIGEAAALDREVAELEQTLAEKRLEGYREVAVELARAGGLPTSALDEAAATIWSLGHPTTYRFLHARGWSDETYRTWLVSTLLGALGIPSGS